MFKPLNIILKMNSENNQNNQNKQDANNYIIGKEKINSETKKNIQQQEMIRTKRVSQKNIKSDEFKMDLGQIKEIKKDKNLKEEEEKNINDNQNKRINKDMFIKKFNKLKSEFDNTTENGKVTEYYLISRFWGNKMRKTIKELRNEFLSKEIGPINNNGILLKQKIIDGALFLEGEKAEITIINPKYEFCSQEKPFSLNKILWDFLHDTFGGGPEIKIKSHEQENNGKVSYKKDFFPYFRINCIVLPQKKKKNNNYNFNFNEYKNEILSNIQTFYTFVNKHIKISDLMIYIEKIVRSHRKISLVDKSNYKCWIDLNYDKNYDYNDLYEKIRSKICDLYNMYSLNQCLAINLDNLEENDESNCNDQNSLVNKFEFKLYPLSIFESEKLLNIFPNQFTNNFNLVNSDKLDRCNKDNNYDENSYIFNYFPQLTIIIEQGKSNFKRNEKNIKYKIDKCNYKGCQKRGILLKFCEDQDAFYCSKVCKEKDKEYHKRDCKYLLAQEFIKENKKFEIKELSQSSGLVGLRNLGNTCYMNTALQCLSNCAELRNYFLYGYPEKDVNNFNVLGFKGLIAFSFENFIKRLWLGEESALNISEYKNAINLCNDRFKGYSQQDTHEFIIFLIDALHEDLNRVNNKIYIPKEEKDIKDELKSKIEWNNFLRRNQSILVDLFYGLFKSTVTCVECKKSCIDFNIFSCLSLNLKYNLKKMSLANIENKINNLNINPKISYCNNINTINESNQKNKEDTTYIKNHTINEYLMKKETNTNKQSDKLSSDRKDMKNAKESNNYFFIIQLIFMFYSPEEKPINLILPIKDKSELHYESLLIKISKIFNKNPYSLYLYHVEGQNQNIKKVYGYNNPSIYDTNNKLLMVSEINPETIRRNLSIKTNEIFYNSSISQYNSRYTSRELIENNFKKNKNTILQAINEIFPKEKNSQSLLNKSFIYNHSMDLSKVYQFTLKNIIKDKKDYNRYPKIFVFSKDQTVFDLYIEIFKMNQIIINENENKTNFNLEMKEKIIKSYFQSLISVNINDFDNNTIFNSNNLPFYLCIQKFNLITNNTDKEIYLLLNEEEKNKKLRTILSNIGEQNNFPNEQLLLNINWNDKYYNKIKDVIKLEKIELFFRDLINMTNNEKNNNSIEVKNENIAINKDIGKENKININNKNLLIENHLKNDNSYNMNKENVNQINNKISLNDLFEILGEEELLDENNLWFCENCKKKQKAEKKLEIYKTPKILIIQIKRFNRIKKLETKVDFPIKNLDINKYIISEDKNKNIKYDLFAVANHYGSLNFGHYTAICKNSLNDKWYEFNDSMVSEIKDISRIISENAYVLFYKQKNLSDLDWDKIYNKKFINININDLASLVDFNYDFIYNSKSGNNSFIHNDKNDINKNKEEIYKQNEFDEKIKEENIFLKTKVDRNEIIHNEIKEQKENFENDSKIREDINGNLNRNYLSKKRSSSSCEILQI